MPAAPLPLPPASAAAALPPLLRPQPEKSGSKLVWIVVILFVLILGGAGGFYFWQKHKVSLANGSKEEAEEEITDNERLAALFGDEKAALKMAGTDLRTNSVSASPAPAARAPQPRSTPVVPVTVTAVPPAPVSTPQPPVRFPPLRLQSIFYRPASPSVIINGKTLFVTDEINGVTVADIQASSVTLVLSGQTNVLTLR